MFLILVKDFVVSLRMVKKMVKAHITIIMEIYMKDNGNKLNFYKER